MFKYSTVLFAIIACCYAKPSGLVGGQLAYSTPLLAAPGVVTATSSQVVARNYNGFAAPILAAAPAPVALAYTAPFAAHGHTLAAPLRYAAPLQYASPLARQAAPAPVALAYTTPLAAHAHTFAAPLAAPLRYAAPLQYASPLARQAAAYAHPYAAQYAAHPIGAHYAHGVLGV